MEVVWAEEKPFRTSIDSVEALYYEEDLGLVQFMGKSKNGGLESLMVSKQKASKNQLRILQEPHAIVPFRPKQEPVITEMDD